MLDAELQLELRVRRESEPRPGVDTGDIAAPRRRSPTRQGHGREELLVPAERAEELGRELVLGLDVVGLRVGVAYPGDLKLRLVGLRPDLLMVPRASDVLPK